ncbi:hypothetical protein LR032_02395 [Candidatus Bipolaricaulota bacterium]|nr:hypothetical protein [Candidatus Bipolaricaulota bacterium]
MKRVLVTLGILLILGSLSALAERVELVYFYEPGCPQCARIDLFLDALSPRHPELTIIRHNIRDAEAHDLLDRLLSAYGVGLGPVPILFIGDVAMVGDRFYGLAEEPVTASGRAGEMRLRRVITQAIAEGAPSPLIRAAAVEGRGLAEKLTIPAIILAAAADSVNPCAFSILILLLGTLITAGKRGKMIPVALSFIAAIYISYLLLGIGLLSAIHVAGIQRPFILVVSILAILFGLWNMKDYFAYGKWFTIEIPQRWRPTVKRLTTSAVSVPGAFAVGVANSLLLLPCSSGPYIAILALVAQTATRTEGIFLLLFYNLIFILPLVLIVFGVYFGLTTTAKTERWRSTRLGQLHFVSGAAMLMLGVGMILTVYLGWI